MEKKEGKWEELYLIKDGKNGIEEKWENCQSLKKAFKVMETWVSNNTMISYIQISIDQNKLSL